MTFLELVSARKSERDYSAKQIEADKLTYVMECARLAPSAVNKQPWMFYIVKSNEAKSQLRKCYAREWFASAPVYIVACGDTAQSWKRASDGKEYCDVDVSIAVEHICLAAAEQGLGTCWVCNFDVDLCRKILNLSDNQYPLAIIPIGYVNDKNTAAVIRKNMDNIVREM